MRNTVSCGLLVLLVTGAASCDKKSQQEMVEPAEPAPENVVDSAVLAPRLLHDEVESNAYLEAFPVADYKVVEVAGQEKFYIDETDDTIKNVLRKGRRWEAHIDKLMRQHIKRGTTAIDAGAHIGTHTMRMGKFVGPTGRVYAFEPQKKLFRELLRNLALNETNNIVALRFAVGAEAAIIEMNPAVAGNEGGTGIGHGGDRAELRTIDSFGFKNVSLLKIDVEGFENAVLDGARETIARSHPVLIVEILGGNDYDTASPELRAKIDATKQKMADLGYTVTKVSSHDYLGVPVAAPLR